MYLHRIVRKWARDESGATLVEYGILATLVVVGSITAIKTLGAKIFIKFSTLGATING